MARSSAKPVLVPLVSVIPSSWSPIIAAAFFGITLVRVCMCRTTEAGSATSP